MNGKRFIFFVTMLATCIFVRPVVASYESLNSVSANADSLTGGVTMSMPIDVPPGRAGIGPNVQFLYSSGLSNDLLGVGWLLELSSIQRSTKHGVPKYDNTDTFVLKQNGSAQELVDIGGGEFALKIEGAFMKIQFIPGMGWRVTDKSGMTYFLGEDQSSQEYDPADSGNIFKWCLNRAQDVHGNTITFDYIREDNTLYLQTMEYTGNPQNGLFPFSNVELIYESREDESMSYISGFKKGISKKLMSIDVKAEGQLQRRYALQYASSNRTGRSLLASIAQYGSDGLTSLPSVTLAYQDNEEPSYHVNDFNNVLSGDHRWNIRWAIGYDRGHDNYGPVPPSRFDVTWQGPSTAESGSNSNITWSVNGNGNLYFSANKDSAYWMWSYLYVDRAKTLSVPYSSGGVIGTWLNNNYSNVGKIWSLNAGYNLVEITAYHQHDGFTFNLNSPLADQVDLMSSNPVSFPAILVGDFNGDGLTDKSHFDRPSGKVDVLLSSGTGFDPQQIWNSSFRPETELFTGDFNGDGKTDICSFKKSDGTWRVALSNGSQFIDDANWITGFGQDNKYGAGEFNADGLTDIVTFFLQSDS
ncbi:MAG: hypothetical protein KAJ14_06450, partial [Candidatus Omnitrophica bacterium]|nr:hypothetical protein [Candidatus Omnitrophota bacterium]